MKNSEEKILANSADFFQFEKSPSLSPKEKDIKIDIPNNFLKFQNHSDNRSAIFELEKRISFLESKINQYENMLTPKEKKNKKLRRKAK